MAVVGSGRSVRLDLVLGVLGLALGLTFLTIGLIYDKPRALLTSVIFLLPAASMLLRVRAHSRDHRRRTN